MEEGAGIEVHYAFARLDPPEELHFDVKGIRNKTKRLEAYCNGSIFVGEDVDLPGTWVPPSERKPN